MKAITYNVVGVLLMLLVSCRTSSYYVSPMYGSSNTYRTLPAIADSIKSRLYTNGALTKSNTNQHLRDDVYTAQTNIYNAHQFGRWKAWYGTGLSSGIYHVRAYPFNEVINPDFDTGYINAHAGNYYFGSLNVNAGAGYCLPLQGGSEWRVLYFSPAVQKEFGNYKNFRNAIQKDSVAITGVATGNTLFTWALGSEITLHTRKQEWFNLGVTYSWIGGKDYTNTHLTFFYETPPHRYSFITLSGAYTFRQHTPFVQFSLGHRLTNLQVGYNYCLRSQKRRQ